MSALNFYARLWTGHRQQMMAPEEFRRKLSSEFIPSTVEVLSAYDLNSYTPGLLPFVKPQELADETALVVYPNKKAYDDARASAAGAVYAAAHNDIFSSQSKSTEPVRIERIISDLEKKGAANLTKDLSISSGEWHPQWPEAQIFHSVFLVDCSLAKACELNFTQFQQNIQNGLLVALTPNKNGVALDHHLLVVWRANARTKLWTVYVWLILPEATLFDQKDWITQDSLVTHDFFQRGQLGLMYFWATRAEIFSHKLQGMTKKLIPLPIEWGQVLQTRWF